jgi:WD40 repeat protein
MLPTDEELDDEAVRLLAAYHEALLAGRPAEGGDKDTPLPAESSASIEGLQACLRRLEDERRRISDSERSAAHVEEAGGRRVGRFQLMRELGHGSFGIVFLALDPVLHREVAVKVPRPEALFTPDLRQRFLREAQSAAGLEHPHIVPVYEAGEADGICYIASAYCPGPTLAAWLKEQPNLVSPRIAASLVTILAEAMQHAHDRGVLHRDLKPGNILLMSGVGDGDETAPTTHRSPLTTHHPKITDFGLAKLLEQDEQNTRSGAILGTPSYMAPEQAAARKDIGPAADIHALGAILYEMLTGRPPFQGPSLLETLEQVRLQEPVPPRRLQPTVPRDLELICVKCLDKDPGRRYGSAAQLSGELRRYLDGAPLAFTRPVSRAEKLWRWARRNRALATAGSAASLLLLTVVIVSLLFGITASRDAGRLRDAADALKDKQRETDKALADARKNAQDAIDNRHWAERQSVELVCDRGLALCEQGEVATGLLWLARSLEIGERSGGSEDLRRDIRVNLAMWSRELHPVQQVLEHHAGNEALALVETDPDKAPKGNPGPYNLGQRALVFRPDGSALLTCKNRSCSLWNTATGQPLGPALQHDDTIYSAAFSPDGRTILTGTKNGRIGFWDPVSGQQHCTSLAHDREVLCVAFSPDGKTTATGGGRVVRLWKSATVETLHPPLSVGSDVMALAFSPDSKLLLVGSWRDAKIWDVATGQQICSLTGAQTSFIVAFSPDGTTCATANTMARLWEVASGKLIGSPLQDDANTTGATMFGTTYSPDSRLLLTACAKGKPRLWNTGTGQLVRELSSMGTLMTASFSPDGRTCIYGGLDGKLRLCSVATGEPLGLPLEHEGGVIHASYSPDGRSILTWNVRGIVQLWDASTRRPLPQPIPITADTKLTAFSPDGRKMVTAMSDGSAHIRDALTGKVVGAPLKHDLAINAILYSPDGKAVLTCSADRTTRLWDAVTGASLGPPLNHADPVVGICWNTDGTKILTITSKEVAQCWDAATGKALGSSFSQSAGFSLGRSTRISGTPIIPPRVYSFDRDGRVMHCAGGGTTGWMKDASASQTLGGPIRHGGQIDTLALSADGRILASGSTDSTARLWDTASGKLLGTLLHQNQVIGLSISSDGQRVLTLGRDDTVRLWNSATSAPIGQPIANATLMSFSRDSRVFFTAGVTTLRAWDAATGKALGPTVTSPAKISALEVSYDGSTVWTLGAEGRRWPMAPLPLSGRPERITRWLQSITCLHLDDGGVARGLSPEKWQANHASLKQLGGPPVDIPTSDRTMGDR